MKTLKVLIGLALCAALCVTAIAWTGVSRETALDPEVLAVREAAWRAWFGGDEKALSAMLPQEFISFGTSGTEFGNLAHALEGSRAFKASGGRLTRLAFPDTRAQRFGDVVILYSLYEADLTKPATSSAPAVTETMRGRATEMFVRRNGRWLHPGWHLDAVAPVKP